MRAAYNTTDYTVNLLKSFSTLFKQCHRPSLLLIGLEIRVHRQGPRYFAGINKKYLSMINYEMN